MPFSTSALRREGVCPPLSFSSWPGDGESLNNSLETQTEGASEDGRAVLLALDLSTLGSM